MTLFKSTLTLACLSLVAVASASNSVNEIWLDEIPSEGNYIQDWGAPQVNKSVLGTTLSINGMEYDRGIGTHAISRMLFLTGGDALRVQGKAGADDNNSFHTKMQFKIFGDGKELWRSGVLHKGMQAKAFDVNLKGVDKVLLLVEECGDGIMYDHADWVDVKFITTGNVSTLPVWAKPVNKPKYILTPPTPAEPKINNPEVFGVTPGADFLWTVMASGERPMHYSATGLPAGVSLDAETGIITGKVSSAGEYDVQLVAENKCGKDTKTVKIKVGDRIALTPPMGWNSWNCWRFSANDKCVRETADVMASKLMPFGWNFVNIDDGWSAAARTEDGVLEGNENFPDFKSTIDYVHGKGLKFGIYSSPGCTTCGNYLASYGHEYIDAETWAKWGVDYLKYDYCSYTKIEKDSEEKTIQEPYIVMRDALDKTGRDIVYCVGYGAPRVWIWGAEAGGNQWRTTRDITDEWNVVQAIGTFQDVCAQATAPGRFNDPDMMVVGNVGGGWGVPKHESLLTADEQYSHVSLWAILSAPLLLGCDMSMLDDFTLSLLTNREVIAVNQDTLCAPAHKQIVPNGQIWHKKLSDGSIALGCFNFDPYFVLWNQDDAQDMQYREYAFDLDFSQYGFDGAVNIRDLWRNEDLATNTNGAITVSVPYHGVKFFKISPANN